MREQYDRAGSALGEQVKREFLARLPGREKKRFPTSSLYRQYFPLEEEKVESLEAAFLARLSEARTLSVAGDGWNEARPVWIKALSASGCPVELFEEEEKKPILSRKQDLAAGSMWSAGGIGENTPFFKRVEAMMGRENWWVFDQYLRVTREALPKGFVVEEIDSKFIIHNEWASTFVLSMPLIWR